MWAFYLFVQDIIKTIAYLQATLIMLNNNTSSSIVDTIINALITKLQKPIRGNMNSCLSLSTTTNVYQVNDKIEHYDMSLKPGLHQGPFFSLNTGFFLKVAINNFFNFFFNNK